MTRHSVGKFYYSLVILSETKNLVACHPERSEESLQNIIEIPPARYGEARSPRGEAVGSKRRKARNDKFTYGVMNLHNTFNILNSLQLKYWVL